jgi:hypothetical protein
MCLAKACAIQRGGLMKKALEYRLWMLRAEQAETDRTE